MIGIMTDQEIQDRKTILQMQAMVLKLEDDLFMLHTEFLELKEKLEVCANIIALPAVGE